MIRGQGLEIGRIHLFYIGPIVVLALILSIGAKPHRALCLLFCLSYIVLGALALLVI